MTTLLLEWVPPGPDLTRPPQGWLPKRVAVCSASDQPIPEQSRGELPQADATSRTPDAMLQVTRASSAVPVGARDDLWPLPSTSTPDDRRSVPPFARQGLPDLAAGNLCPDDSVKSPRLRLAIKLALPSNNVTRPVLSKAVRLAAALPRLRRVPPKPAPQRPDVSRPLHHRDPAPMRPEDRVPCRCVAPR